MNRRVKPNRPPKRTKPFVPRWTAHVEAKKRDEERASNEKAAAQKPFDDGFRGVLPPGAIRADARRQHVEWGFERLYYYEDLPFTCRTCGKLEVWTARQQQWWYEVSGRGYIGQTAIACRACRKQRRDLGAATTERIWLARFARLQRVALDAARFVQPGPEGESPRARLDDLRCAPDAEEKLVMAGIVTVQDLQARRVTSPIEGVTLRDLDVLLMVLKRKLAAARNGYAWDIS